MKIRLLMLVSALLFLYGEYTIASCGGGSGCRRQQQSQDNNCASGSCYSSTSRCSSSYYGNSCACSDPVCKRRDNCISQSECCQAYGNIGRD